MIKKKHLSGKLIGRRFGSLTVTAFFGLILHHRRWECVCDCGEETILSTHQLVAGEVVSCEGLAHARNDSK